MRPQAPTPWRKTLRAGAREIGCTGRARQNRLVRTTERTPR